MAQIEKRGDSYRIRVFLGRTADGKTKYKSITYHPEATTPAERDKEVRRYADLYEARVKGGRMYDDKVTLSGFVETWRKTCSPSMAETSISAYMRKLNKYWLPKYGHMRIGSIKAPLIQAELAKLSEKHKRATVEAIYSPLRSVLSKAYKWGVIEENPCSRVEVPKERVTGDAPVRYFTVAQANAFLKYVSDDVFWSAYFTLAINGGFRRGEMAGLKWKCVDFSRKEIHIEASMAWTPEKGYFLKEPKTESSRRTVPLPDQCFEKLKVLKQEQLRRQKVVKPGGFVFAKPGHDEPIRLGSAATRIQIDIKRYNELHPDAPLPLIHLHDLRHTTATLMVAAGIDIPTVSALLGHGHISTTLDMYTHPVSEKQRQATEELGRLLNG